MIGDAMIEIKIGKETETNTGGEMKTGLMIAGEESLLIYLFIKLMIKSVNNF